MANENVDIVDDVLSPLKNSSLNLDAEFQEPAPAKTAPTNQPAQTQEEIDSEEAAYFTRMTGASPAEIRGLVEEKRNENTARAFVADHQNDFVPSRENERILTGFLEQNNLPFTRENIEIAFAETKSQLHGPGSSPKPVLRKPATSGISSRDSAADIPVTEQSLVEEAYSLPLDQLRDKIQRRAYAAGKLGPAVRRGSHSLEPEY